ncbi:MAG: hypothetical protein ABI867_45240 [Kofleriaceae bacterium]
MILAIVLVSASARADDASEATRLFEEGRALLEQKNYTEACAKFARSSALDRKPGTQLNLGDCAERGGQLRRAWLLFDDAAREYERIQKSADARLVDNPTSPDAARDSQVAAAGSRFARQRADALSPRLAKVIVRLTGVRPEGLTVRIGDRAVPPATEIVELLDPGVIPVTVTAPGHEPFTSAPRVESGKQAVVEVPELRVPGKPDDRIGAPEAGRQRSRVRIAIALAAGSALAFAVTTAVGLSARSQYNRAEQLCTRDAQQELSCPPGAADDIDSAGTKADFATVTGIAGGLLAAGAFVVYFTAPRESVQIAPIASPNSAGISIFGRF